MHEQILLIFTYRPAQASCNSIYIVKSARLILSNSLIKAVLLGLRQVLKSL